LLVRALKFFGRFSENKEGRKDYLNGYKQFFNNFYKQIEEEIKGRPSLNGVDEEIIKRRVLDRALWEYGRKLNE